MEPQSLPRTRAEREPVHRELAGEELPERQPQYPLEREPGASTCSRSSERRASGISARNEEPMQTSQCPSDMSGSSSKSKSTKTERRAAGYPAVMSSPSKASAPAEQTHAARQHQRR